MIPENIKRGNFGSRFGFVLAAAGSAIGLGNIWRFPYVAAENGGGAFVLLYLVFILGIGVPVIIAELSVGRASQKNPVGAFRALAPGSWWPAIGGIGVLTGFGILSFYSVVAGWTLGYIVKTLKGDFLGGITGEESGAAFDAMSQTAWVTILLTAIFMLLTILVVRGGVSKGIERAAKILMPVLFVLLVFLAVRAVTLPGAGEGLRHLFSFEYEKITIQVVVKALGQAFFSLSLGMGAMITYGSYLQRKENLTVAGATVAGFDTLIALLAGVIIFPALAAAGVDPESGPPLVFVVLPTIFDSLPMGNLFGLAFYVLLAIAALTSTVSLLEVVVSYFIDERGWRREVATWTFGGLCLLLAIPSALSQGAVPWLSEFMGMGFQTLLETIFADYSLSVGGVLICVFVGWRWGIDPALEEIRRSGDRFALAPLWRILIMVVCPLAIAIVLGFTLWSQFWGA